MKSFNLTTEPWIKVLDKKTNSELMVSLKELFQNASSYRQLAGDMHAQDLSILRLLEAILMTVYTRVNQNGQEYEWLTLDNRMCVQSYDDEIGGFSLAKALTKTWISLYKAGQFSESVCDYLDKNKDLFDFFGSKPFYQVTAKQYDSFAPEKKKIFNRTGTVALKQINRLISESGNSISVFSPKSQEMKNEMSLDELVRWLITYQNFAGGSDKTKIKKPVSPGWLYEINPIFVQGQNLFETLMLNMVLFNPYRPEYTLQRPVWEEELNEYVKKRLSRIKPDNFAETYTVWSRLLYIEWQNDTPTIFSACLPSFENINTFDIEPMSTWMKKKGNYCPEKRNIASLAVAMWRNFGQYIATSGDDDNKPLSVVWINYLKGKIKFNNNREMINLHTSGLIDDQNPFSKMPVAEFDDNLRIEANVLFDQSNEKKNIWPTRIEEMVKLNQKIGKKYHNFLLEVGKIRFDSEKTEKKIRNKKVELFANRQSQFFYDALNEPFTEWLAGLTSGDDREAKQEEWTKELREVAFKILNEFLDIIAPRDISGKGGSNIFIIANKYRTEINKALSNG